MSQLEPDYASAYDSWKAADTPDTRTGLLTAVKPVLTNAVRRYGNNPGLQSKAKLIALDSFQSYDPYKGPLQAHLNSQLRGLQRFNAQQQNIISIPERVSIEYKGLLDAENELRDTLGTDPSDRDIADYTGMSLKRLNYIRQSQKPQSESSVERLIGVNDIASSPLHFKNQQAAAWVNFIYDDLGRTDQLILDYSLGRNGTPKLNTKQIADRLNITSGAISQRLKKIQAYLDQDAFNTP